MKNKLFMICLIVLGFALLELTGWRLKINSLQRIKRLPIFVNSHVQTERSENYNQLFLQENGQKLVENGVGNAEIEKQVLEEFGIESLGLNTRDGVIIFQDGDESQFSSFDVDILPLHDSDEATVDEVFKRSNDEINNMKLEMKEVYYLLGEVQNELQDGLRYTFLIGMLFSLILLLLISYLTELYFLVAGVLEHEPDKSETYKKAPEV